MIAFLSDYEIILLLYFYPFNTAYGLFFKRRIKKIVKIPPLPIKSVIDAFIITIIIQIMFIA